MQKRALVGTILVLVALIFIGSTFILPWYSIRIEFTSSLDMTYAARTDYYLDHAVNTQEETGFTGMEETEKTEVSYNNESLKDLNVIKTFKTTNILVFVGIIGCLLGLIGAAMVAAGKLRKDVGAAFVLLAVILILLAPLYIMFTLPSAFEEDTEGTGAILFAEGMFEDFFGSDIEESMGMSIEATWGGSTGWFLTIFAAIICIIALILVAISKPISAPTFQEMPTPLDMYAQPYDIVQPQQQRQFYADEETFPQYPSPLQIPRPQGEEFQCPNCSSIFILTFTKRPAIIRCPYCGLEGLVE